MVLVVYHLVAALVATLVAVQVPQPFPPPGGTQPATPQRPPVPAPFPTAQVPPADPNAPTDATLGFPLYPTAQFIASYDAGRGQRYYVFGTTAPYAELVLYYRTQLKERGNQVFEQPPTHMFEIGRFRE